MVSDMTTMKNKGEKVEKRVTAGSASPEFVKANFTENKYKETVLISANPFTHKTKFKQLTGNKLEDVFHEHYNLVIEKWDEEKGTVLPEEVRKTTETVEKLYPEKRKIIWFFQPHYPFYTIGDTSGADPEAGKTTLDAWQKAQRGIYKHEHVVKGYKQNIEDVMKHVKKLKQTLTGKTTLTADHGNLIGENGFYGHPKNQNTKQLRETPIDTIKE